ncbi:MAG TPA: hypothetical protein VF794_39060 [Archangium sp.]|uniref:hypothetical protein n=1 Tax=Archangium sp. TaxID=1872627 RepID=UPI002ED9840D
MSIRRIGGFNPSVQTAQLIESQRRVEAVEKHIGADDPALMTEEQQLEALNAKLQAELEAVEAERTAQAREAAELRSQLMNVDGFERAQRELLDLKGGAEAEPEVLPGVGQGGEGVSLAHLARASVYAAAQARSAVEEAAAAVSAQHEADEAEVAAPAEDDWMQAELAALQTEVDGADEVEASEAAYNDPGADAFVASLDDIANLEEGGAGFGDAGADAFVASLDDIANLVPEVGAEVAGPGEAEGLVEAPAAEVVDSFEAAPAPVMLPFDDEGGPDAQG